MTDAKMVTVQRANVILSVPDDQLDHYMSQGYNVIDESGKVIKQSVPRELGTLQKAYVEHLAEIEQLKKEIKKLKAKKKEK